MKTRKPARPDIIVSRADHERLTQMANGLLDRRPELADQLLNELERARLLETNAVPANRVRMGSGVEYRVDDGQARRVTLVYPGEADIAQGKVSVLTPIGTALLGLSVGQAIDFVANDGRPHRLTILAVETARTPVA